MFTFRPAAWQDSELIWIWRNDPLTRRHSLNSREIPWEEHKQWFRQSLTLPNRKLMIIERGPVALGVLRLDELDPSRIEISIHLAPAERNRGYGQQILKMIPQFIHQWYPQAQTLIAKIKKANTPSLQCFRKAGFAVEKEEGNIVYMALTLAP